MTTSDEWQVASDKNTSLFMNLFKTIWRFLLEAFGENDYKRYRERLLARGETPLGPAAFYVSNLERKYSRPNRCC